MTIPGKISTDCFYLGEFVDKGPMPQGMTHGGEVVRPEMVISGTDVWTADSGIQEFTVLLKDNRTCAIAGHAVKLFQPESNGEGGSYGIVVRAANEEIIVALFRTAEVLGIFHGEVHPSRKIA